MGFGQDLSDLVAPFDAFQKLLFNLHEQHNDGTKHHKLMLDTPTVGDLPLDEFLGVVHNLAPEKIDDPPKELQVGFRS